MNTKRISLLAWLIFPGMVCLAGLAHGQAALPGGVKVALDGHTGPATVKGTLLEKFRLRVELSRQGEAGPLNVRVELPATGRDVWPVNDVEVRDDAGTALLVQRDGIVWEKLLVPVAGDLNAFVVQAVKPAVPVPPLTADKDRVLQDPASGAQVRVGRWPKGRVAALSLRFDDSHFTHLQCAIPALRQHGLKGTFMVNVGPAVRGSRQRYDFETQWQQWQEVALRGDMELANHTAHHRGAKGDEDMELEIGHATQTIWQMAPAHSKLIALNLGGGTHWETTRTLRYYLDKYQLFDASSGSLGMDDVYGGRVEAFRKALQTHIERGLWCRVHYHSIGQGMATSEENFRQVLRLAQAQKHQVWVAGMADIYKYQTERSTAKLAWTKPGTTTLAFQLDCATDPALYDQPLTLEITPPAAWKSGKIIVKDKSGATFPVLAPEPLVPLALRVEVPPVDAEYFITEAP